MSLMPVIFTSADGTTQVPSYLAVPAGGRLHPAVLILRGVAGPDDGYTEIAERLADWGYAALMHGWKVRGNDPPDDLVHADMAGRAHEEVRLIVVFHGFAFRSPRAQPGAQPYDLVETVKVPTLIMHGTEDEQAPLDTMQRMEARMRSLGKSCAFTYYPGARHGFAVRTHPGFEAHAAAQSFEEARRFLDTHLRGGGHA